MDKRVAVIEDEVHDSIMTAMETLVMPEVELSMRSVNASLGNGPQSVA